MEKVVKYRKIYVTSLTGKTYKADMHLLTENKGQYIKWWIEVESFNDIENTFEMVELPACNGYFDMEQENDKTAEEIEKVYTAFENLKCIDFSMDM